MTPIPLQTQKVGITAEDEELARLAKALGHPVRNAILRLLRQHGQCICGEIVDQLPVAQATVSQHLQVLREAELLQGEVDGPRVCYCDNPKTLKRFQTLLEKL